MDRVICVRKPQMGHVLSTAKLLVSAGRAVHGLHTPRFTLDESVLKLGAALHTALATEYLDKFQAAAATAGKEEL